jgi:hypothetical protein
MLDRNRCRLSLLTGVLASGAVLAGDWRSAITDEIERSEYRITRRDDSVIPGHPGGLHATNRAQDLRAYFTAEDVRIVPRTANPPGWMLRLALRDVEAVDPEPRGRAVTYRRGNVIERYENDERGILVRLEARGDAGSLAFDLDTRLTALQSSDGTRIDFYDGGRRVAGLEALGGAAGRPAMLALAPGLITVGQRAPAGAPPFEAVEAGDVVTAELVLTGAGEEAPVGPSSTPDRIVAAEQGGAGFAVSLAPAGDVNGDGFSDLVVGAPEFDIGLPGAGRVIVYLGSADGLITEPHWSADGDAAGAELGRSVASAGDVDGDGTSDVIVGAPGSDTALIFRGSPTGVLSQPWTLTGASGSRFGFAVASAGNVDGDALGLADAVVGAPLHPGGGRATVFFAPFDAPSGGSACLAVPDSSCAFEGLGCFPAPPCPNDTAQLGFSVASAGDVDGDERADVIVGAPFYRYPRDCDDADCSLDSVEGNAFVYLGAGLSPGGPCATDADWCSKDANNGSVLEGSMIGYSVGTAGDVDGDGLSDVIIGAPHFNHDIPATSCDIVQQDVGAALVFRDILCEGVLCPDPWLARGRSALTRFGASVASAGDANGDGIGDVIVGAPDRDGGAPDDGAAFLYLGSEKGLRFASNEELAEISSGGCGIDSNAALPETADWFVEGGLPGSRLGESVASAGDVNGDGLSDVVVGLDDAAWVFHGRGFGPQETEYESFVSLIEGNDLGWSVAMAGDVNGDGWSDVIVGLPGAGSGDGPRSTTARTSASRSAGG